MLLKDISGRGIKRILDNRHGHLVGMAARRRKVTVSKSGSGVVVGRKTRNIGVMAHIDAGKTTTTERMLFYAGAIAFPGEVHHGDTVTDFLPQERQRGITIQSALVTFPWNDVTINLIDTPGHVDFTFEVQRALRVVDSAVAIVDASAGVEAQTLTVWRQATDYKLPRLLFLNKMDKTGACVDSCVQSIKSKLKCTPLILQQPVYTHSRGKLDTASGFIGLLDFVLQKKITYNTASKGVKYSIEDVRGDREVGRRRSELVEQVADVDGQLANQVIERESTEAIEDAELVQAIRRATLRGEAVPLLLGTAYKNMGVQPLLDAICKYLPDSEESHWKDDVVSAFGKELCCFAFKTLHDPQLGPLTFVRVFSGTLSAAQKIFNVTRAKSEKVLKIYNPLADDLREVDTLVAGQVGIVSGLKETFTGDTMASSNSMAVSVAKKLGKSSSKEMCLSGVDIPQPVFFCSVEPGSISQEKCLNEALECLQREDPSLQVHSDPDTDQTVLSGMGELHLEIIHDRLKNDFKVDADLGKLHVAYKETILTAITKRTDFERKLADQKQKVTIELDLRPGGEKYAKVTRAKTREAQENLAHLTDRQMNCIQNGVNSALRTGPKLRFPVVDVQVFLNYFDFSRGTSEAIIEAAAATCVRNALQETHCTLLEPVVHLEIVVDENYQKRVVEDLHRRRFQMQLIDRKHGNKVIIGKAPLSELMGYSTVLRTISSGLGTFSMHFNSYQVVNDPFQENKIFEHVRGF